MAGLSHQNSFGTNLTSNTTAGETSSPLNTVPSITPPFFIVFDATGTNSHTEVRLVTSKTATNVNHAATTYDHTTAEEVRIAMTAEEMDLLTQVPQGYMRNGKISVTDAAGITVAIKTMAGADPTPLDPVAVRIGDTNHLITSALSVAKADGTNWCNAGSAELATKEIDYFVYLGYNATDGVVIGFSRIPGANQYSDFSATTTNEKYCAISTITNAAATDYYEVIGRFAATLSAGAGYTWSVPTYTAKNLIQRPIYTTRELDYVSVLSVAAGTSPTYTTQFVNKYRVSMDAIWVFNQWNNTAGGTAGAGTGVLYSTFPFSVSNYVANRSPVGSGWSHEGAGTESVVTTVAGSAANNFNMYYGGNAVLGNDQSSADRSISVTHSFKI